MNPSPGTNTGPGGLEGREEFPPTRQTLLSRLRDWEDRESWQEFFDCYWKLIYRAGRKADLADADAQEVVQEVVVAAAKQLPKFKYDPAIGSFKGQGLRTRIIVDNLLQFDCEATGLAWKRDDSIRT